MSGVYWIASYPKSGNTWLRFLACNLVFGTVESAESLNRMAPDLHELSPAFVPPPQPLLMKAHYRFSPDLRFADRTVAAAYVLRDPADVMISNFYYRARSGTAIANEAAQLAQYVDAFIAAGGDPRWIKLGMGTWEQNVRSWTDPSHGFPVLRIRYEDVLNDGPATGARLCQWLGISRTPTQVAAALANCSFGRMRQIEEADIAARRVGVFYKPYLQGPIESGMRFMRSGSSGSAASALSDAQWRRFNAVFGDLRAEFGYH